MFKQMKMKKQLFYFALVSITLTSCGPVYKCGDPRPETKPGGGNRFVALLEERDDLCDEVKIKEKENIRLSDRNEELVNENDSLITRNGELVKEYAELENTHNELIGKHDELKKEHINLGERYSSMMSDNFQRGYYYEEQLKNREQKLAAKEKELAERQRRIEELERIIAEQDSIAKRLNRLLKEALLGFKSDELTIEIKNGKVYVSMSDKLMFKSGSAKVESKGREALAILGRVINQNTEFEILIEGHTDNVPISTSRYKDNWDLSVDRATSMVRILADEHKVDETRMTAAGRGEFMPRASNDSAEGRAKNRRTEIILSPKLDELMNMISE
jgi:chemotaxis protein MotB